MLCHHFWQAPEIPSFEAAATSESEDYDALNDQEDEIAARIKSSLPVPAKHVYVVNEL